MTHNNDRPKTAGPLSREEKVERRGKRISQLRLLQADVKVNLGAVYASLAGKYTADANKAGHEGDQEMAAERASKAQETLSESKKAYVPLMIHRRVIDDSSTFP